MPLIFKTRWKRILVISTLLVLGFFIYNSANAAGGSGKTNGKDSKGQQSAKVEKGNLEEKLTISGVIDAKEKVVLRFQTSGRLSWVGVKEGDYVKKSQAIASLDQRDVRKRLEKELNDYKASRNDFDQSKDTYKDQIYSDAIKRIVEKSQATLNNSVLDVELQSLAIEYSHLVTPIEGIVTRVGSPFSGVNITPSQAEFEIINPHSIFFDASADQTEVGNLKEGMSGELVLDAYPDITFAGHIETISFVPKSGETGTVYGLRFVFTDENNDFSFKLGMAGDLSLAIRNKPDALYVPEGFVKEEKDQKDPAKTYSYVQVKKNGKFEKKRVITGIETDTQIEILSGVGAGETVYD